MSQQLALSTLPQLEDRIERGLDTFVDVGLALMEVRDRRLYREAGYSTFEKYCVGRWNFKRHRAYQLIEAAQTVQVLQAWTREDVDNCQQNPTNEAQVRELTSLVKSDPDVAREVWQEVNEENGDKVTASKVREAVQRRKPVQASPPTYGCETCGEIHDRPVWHCDGCDKHYPRTQRSCPDCDPAPEHPVVMTSDLELLRDARYTLEEARDVLGADTSAGGMVTGLIRNLDDVVKNIRRWRGEQV